MSSIPSTLLRNQRGASAVEFVVVALVLFMMGLGTLQAALLYHSKTIVNYATFEAARVGTTNHALVDPMMSELGERLAPLFGGDGTMGKAALAIARSKVEVESPVNLDGSVAPPTSVKVLNPSTESFEKWGRPSLEYNARTAIPNSHLKHKINTTEGEDAPSMTLADANLLKIQVTHGVELKIPLINKMILSTMREFELLGGSPDPEKLAYYAAGRIPITSTATMRMQSEAWKETTAPAAAALPFANPSDPPLGLVPDSNGSEPTQTPLPDTGAECSQSGLDTFLYAPHLLSTSCPGRGDGEGDGGAQSGC